jgi:hypothetical protein
MTALRMLGGARALGGEMVNPGDTLILPDQFTSVATVGAATLTAGQLVSGNIFRSGSVAGYVDTLDTSAALLLALQGNNPGATVIPGMTFKLRIYNSVAFAETITLGSGMVAGNGTIASVAASTWRDFLFQFSSVQPAISNLANTVNGSPVVTWYLPPGQAAEPIGVNPLSINIVPGAFVSGTGIPAGATVIGLTMGPGGTLGFTLSANATATNSNVSLTFSSLVTVHSLGSGTL